MNPIVEYRERNGLTRKALARLSRVDAAQWSQILGIAMSWAMGGPKKHAENSPWRKSRMGIFTLVLLVAGATETVREWCVSTHEGVEVFCWLEIDEE